MTLWLESWSLGLDVVYNAGCLYSGKSGGGWYSHLAARPVYGYPGDKKPRDPTNSLLLYNWVKPAQWDGRNWPRLNKAARESRHKRPRASTPIIIWNIFIRSLAISFKSIVFNFFGQSGPVRELVPSYRSPRHWLRAFNVHICPSKYQIAYFGKFCVAEFKVCNNIGGDIPIDVKPKYWTGCDPGIPGGVDASEGRSGHAVSRLIIVVRVVCVICQKSWCHSRPTLVSRSAY